MGPIVSLKKQRYVRRTTTSNIGGEQEKGTTTMVAAWMAKGEDLVRKSGMRELSDYARHVKGAVPDHKEEISLTIRRAHLLHRGGLGEKIGRQNLRVGGRLRGPRNL